MIEQQTLTDINKEDLVSSVKKMKDGGFRLVQIGCTKSGDIYEVNYSFDRKYKFHNLRVVLNADESIESIQSVYGASFIYENEILDLYGIKVNNMLIDFKGKLYKTAVESPFK